MGMKEEFTLNESKMGDLLIDIQMGATAKELARDHNITLAAAKSFLSDYYGNKKTRKAPGLKKEYAVLDTGLDKALKKFKVKFSKTSFGFNFYILKPVHCSFIFATINR